MTAIQRQALEAMAHENVGAVRVGTIYGISHGGRYDTYAFPVDIRVGSATATGDDIALAVLALLAGDARDCETLPVS